MNVVFKVSKQTQDKLIDYYKEMFRDKKPPYSVFQADDMGTIITLYESGKVMFQGVSADSDAMMWQEIDKGNLDPNQEFNYDTYQEESYVKGKYYNASTVGSDEVGTGSYFGPIVVTATFVDRKDVSKLHNMGIGDSKRFSDEIIKKITPELLKIVKYKSYILDNKEYNNNHSKEFNLNKMKAVLHNKVLRELINEEKPKYQYIVVDQFTPEKNYYNYLKDVKEVQDNISFVIHAEDECLSVGAASIIARYIFLQQMDKISDELGIPLPLGSGEEADNIGKEIVKKYGKDKLNEIAKVSFKNTEKILSD